MLKKSSCGGFKSERELRKLECSISYKTNSLVGEEEESLLGN